MFSHSTRLSILGLTLALAAVISSPVLAGSRSTARESAESGSLAVELARGVVGAEARHEVYQGTGERIDLTVPVVADRLAE